MQYSKMEKSMVQELSVLTHSTVFSSRPSFLSHEPDRLELRRSRIQNLPGYRKEDLSSKLNFVVVFQTIQIERLTQQVETLRIMVRDAERQRLNFQNYEVQIRELTERCHSSEMHREDLLEELERMKVFTVGLLGQLEAQAASKDEGIREKYQAERSRADQLQGEVERWRNRYSGLQAARVKELQQLRGQFQARRRSQISRETRELTIKYENEVAALSSDLRKARQEVQLRGAETMRLQQLVGKFRVREEEMLEVEQKMYEYENRFVLLSQENYRLNELLRKRSEDLDRVRREAAESRSRADSRVGLQEELSKLQVVINEKQQAIDQLQSRLRASREQKEQMSLQVQKGRDYIRLVEQLQGEVQRLNIVLRDKINQAEQGRSSQRILESKLAAATAATQKQCAAYEQRIVSFTKEQERLNAQLKHRLAENEQLRVRCAELERMGNSNDSLRQENEQLRAQLGQFSNKLEQSKRKIKLHEDNLVLMEDIQKKLRSEQQLKRELLLDREKLNASIRELTLKAETATIKAQSTQDELFRLASVEGELSQCKKRLAWMTQEMDRINSEIQSRVAEIHQLRQTLRTLGSNKANYQGIQQTLVQNLAQMEQMVLQVDQTRRENDRLHDDNMNLQTSIHSLQGQIITLQDERDQRIRLLSAQASQMNELRQKGQAIAIQVKARQQAESALQQQTKKLQQFKAMYTQLQERFARETAHSEAMVYQLMQIRSQPRVGKELAEELVGLRRMADEQRIVIAGLLNRMDGMHSLLRAVRERYGMEMEEVSILKQRVQKLMSHSQCLDDMEMLLHIFGERMDSLREEKFRLESEKTLINVEYCQSLKILQEPTGTLPIHSTPVIQNSSIAMKVVSADETHEEREENSYLFTFKEVHRQNSLPQQQDAINQRTQTEENEASRSHSPEEGSMASSFINTLITKESSARFDLRPPMQQETEGNAFGYIHNQTSKLRYLPDRFQDYNLMEREIENHPAQLNRAVSPSQRSNSSGAFFETAGIKRVVSYTHFAPTMFPSSPHAHPHPVPSSPTAYPCWQGRDSPSGLSPNTANSTNELSQLGRRIRITADPARLLLYRNQH